MSTKQQTYNPYHQPNPDQIISLTTGTEDDKQKKPIVRRTVDYHTTIINYLETRAYFPTFREFKRIYATSNAIRHMRPIPFEKSNESHGFCTKYVSTSINKHKCAINCLIWSPEGRRLITGNAMGQFTLWNGLKFNFDTILPAHEYPIRRMIWKYDDEILKWDYQYFEFNDNDKYTYYTQNEHGYSILYRCIFTSEGILKDLIQIKLPFKCVLAAGDQRSYTKALCINSTNNLLTVTMSNSFTPTNMFVIDLKSMKCNQISYVSTPGININNFVNCTLHSFKSFDGLNVSYFRYKPNNNLLISNDSCGYIKYWTQNMKNLINKRGHDESINDMCFSTCYCKFASVSADGYLKIWDFSSCKTESATIINFLEFDINNCNIHSISGNYLFNTIISGNMSINNCFMHDNNVYDTLIKIIGDLNLFEMINTNITNNLNNKTGSIQKHTFWMPPAPPINDNDNIITGTINIPSKPSIFYDNHNNNNIITDAPNSLSNVSIFYDDNNSILFI